MTLLEILRNKAFWAIDRYRGGKISKYFKLLKHIEGNNSVSGDEILSYHKEKIRELLTHCVQTVPAYNRLAPLLEQENPLTQWPVINKMTLKNGGDRYLSDAFKHESLIPMATSGSTGTPFVNWQNHDKKRHVNAEVLFYNGEIGYEIGRKIIYFRSVANEVKKSRLQQFMQNISLIDCRDLSDDGIRTKIRQIRKLSKNGGAMILSYASTLDAFCRYFEKHGTKEACECNVYGIISGSEMLKDSTREILSEAFNCKVLSRYANEENGFIGQDGIENNVFIPNRANYYIEILKFDSDKPASQGEIGRIVITDLYNMAMPMVRYDTGDVGAWQNISVKGTRRQAIGKFGGRRVDMIFDTKGNIISPHSITNFMWRFNNTIKQYQFIQQDKAAYRIRVNLSGKCDHELLVSGIKNIVGTDAGITVEECNEIPVLASGQRRYIVNSMNK